MKDQPATPAAGEKQAAYDEQVDQHIAAKSWEAPAAAPTPPREMKPSRDYSTTPRAEAVRHFRNREVKLEEEIRSLPTAEKFRLVADFMDAPAGSVPAKAALSIARVALAELEGLAP